jgi:hypothetical protein
MLIGLKILLIVVRPNLITWSSCKQPIVSRSSTEAKYKALVNAMIKVIWIQIVLGELGIHLRYVPGLWYDNLGATYKTTNPRYNDCTKHIKVDFHFVHEQVTHHQLDVWFISSSDQATDDFTKPLPTSKLEVFCGNLNLIEL